MAVKPDKITRALMAGGFLVSSLLSSGCAAMFNKNAPIMVPVSTDPPGATVSFSGGVHQSPAMVYLPRGKGDVQMTIEKEGYRTETVLLKQVWDDLIWTNLAFGYMAPLGMIVDLHKGSGYTLQPNMVYLKLIEDSQNQATSVTKQATAVTYPAVTILDGQLGDLVQQLTGSFRNHGVSRVAILPVEDMAGQNQSPLARYLTDKLTIKMHGVGTVAVIERASLAKVSDELVLMHSGGFRDDSLKRVGQFLGADCIVTGIFAELGPHAVEFNAKAIRIETGEIIGVGAILVQKDMVPYLVQ